MTKRVAGEMEVQIPLKWGNAENPGIGPVSKMARILDTKLDEEAILLKGRAHFPITSGTFKVNTCGEIHEVKVVHEGHTYSYNFAKKAEAEGSTKKLFGAHAYSEGAPPYLAVLVDPQNLRSVENGREILAALHKEGVEFLDDPPRQVECEGPNGKKCTIHIVKTKNRGSLYDYSLTDEFKNLTAGEHLQLIKDLIKGQYLQDQKKVIQLDGKLENILVQREGQKTHIFYTDFDAAILFRKEFYTDKIALRKFIAHLAILKGGMPNTFTPSPKVLGQLEIDFEALLDYLKQHKDHLSEQEHGPGVEQCLNAIYTTYLPFEAYQLGVTLYRLYTNKVPDPEIDNKECLARKLLERGIRKEAIEPLVSVVMQLLSNTPDISLKEVYERVRFYD